MQVLAYVGICTWYLWLLVTGHRDAPHALIFVVLVNFAAGAYDLTVMGIALLFPGSDREARATSTSR